MTRRHRRILALWAVPTIPVAAWLIVSLGDHFARLLS